MRVLQGWWRSLVWVSRDNPPQVVEAVMLLMALLTLGLWWFQPTWAYIPLFSSYSVGAIALMLVRETINPSYYARLNRVIAIAALVLLLLGLGAYCTHVLPGWG